MSMLPQRRSDPNLPSTSNQATNVTAATAEPDHNHDLYATPYNVEQEQLHQAAAIASTSRSHSGHRKKHTHHRRHQHHHHHHHHHRKHGERENAQTDTLSMIPYPDDDDLFLSSGTIATNLLTSLKQPSKMTFNWSRQFNETLATISGLLQRNFQESPYPGCNVSEASASTATLGSSTAIDSIAKTQSDKWQKRRRNSLTGDPRELDMLVLEPVNGDDSDGF